MDTTPIAPEVLACAQRFTDASIASITRITDGSINTTYEVKTDNDEVFILQKMSSLFKPSVMDNLAVIAPYVRAAHVLIPEGLKTTEGELYIVEKDGSWYRALSYIKGETIHKGIGTQRAHSAGRLTGSFHCALASCETQLVEAIKHYHDSNYYFEKMHRTIKENSDEMKRDTLAPIVAEIERKRVSLSSKINSLPTRIIHADLKVSNIRFSEAGEAVALIDMDTVMRANIVIEMGDALRSWCGTAGEDDSEQVFDVDICKAAIAGYIETAERITQEEISLIPEGIRLLTLELASRFVTDAFEEDYFAQSSLYPSLYEQNKTRAENQLRFLDAYEAKIHLL